jgi:hypothetical protein
MKVSKKEIQKFQAKEQRRREGHVANNLEQDQTLEALKKKLEDPQIMAVLRRMKDR